MKTVAEIEANLAQAIGTESYTRHLTNAFVLTDGVNQLRVDADCFWLIDAIASYRRKEPFQVWEFKMTSPDAGVLTMVEDSGQPELVRQEIEYTNFPLKEIKFFVEEGGYGTEENWTNCLVLLLPSEH